MSLIITDCDRMNTNGSLLGHNGLNVSSDMLSSGDVMGPHVSPHTSDIRKKIQQTWIAGDQIPLQKLGDNRPTKAFNRKKGSPKKKNKEAKDELSEEDLQNLHKRMEDTIETVVKSDSEMDESLNSSRVVPIAPLTTHIMEVLNNNSDINSVDVKSETLNDFNPNNCENGLNQNQRTKRRRRVEKTKSDQNQPKRRKSKETLLNESSPLPSFSERFSQFVDKAFSSCNSSNDTNNTSSNMFINNKITTNNVINGLIGQQMTINGAKDLLEKSQKSKEVKPKRIRKPKSLINGSNTPLKIKTSSLFSSVFNNNPFIQFLNKPSVSSSVSTSDNSSLNLKLQNYRKPKSETQLMAKKRVNMLRGIKPSNVKIKRSRIRPVVVKNFSEQKSFLDFVSKKFQPIKEGVPTIQDRSCKDLIREYESPDLNQCLDCIQKKINCQTCRFMQYRTVMKKDDHLVKYAFAEEGNATHDDCKIWLPLSIPPKLEQKTAIYLLIFVGKEFCRLYKEEQQIAELSAPVTWKKPVNKMRELCDICETTIFNAHYVCPNCGLAVCVDCFSSRKSAEKHSTTSVSYNTRHKNRDEFGWLLCKDKQKQDLDAFQLAIFITQAVFGSMNQTYHLIRNLWKIRGLCDCTSQPNCPLLPELNYDMRDACSQTDVYTYCPEVPRQWLCDNKVLLLTEPEFADNLKLFQIYWLRGFPVIIEKVNKKLDYKQLWTPQSFNNHFGKQMNRLVNCINGSVLQKQPMSHFWDGFEDVDQRLSDELTRDEMILKLKDWPPNAEFRDMLPRWFDNLMDALPLQEYTRYDGCRNLASRLPEFFVRPDLGPKMYCAYGSVLHPDKGTTNLHLDMSDAVNVMIYVGVAKKGGQPLQSHLDGADDLLLKGGCDPQMMTRAKYSELKVGALWHIWKAEDADKIRHFLNKVSKEQNIKIEANNDPIHDQSSYLDENLRLRLENEYNVKGVAIAQCLGDAILVPAGAPHQVQNIHSCIKVAGEFVSPENVSHCLAMTQQFRNLSKRHNNHEDKLQIKNIIYHSIKDSLSILLPPTSNINFPIPPKPKLLSETLREDDSMTENIANTEPIDIVDNESTNSLNKTHETICTESKQNCDSMQLQIETTEELHKTENELSHSKTTCISNDDFVDQKTTDSVDSNKIVCNELKVTICETNQTEGMKSHQTCESPLPSPPLLTPFDDPIVETDKKSDSPLESTQSTNNSLL